MTWITPAPRWDTLAGHVLDSFCEGIREAMPSYDFPLTLFGSAAIQLCYDEHFTSADVDLMVMAEGERLRSLATHLGLGRSGTVKASYGLQICPPQFFRTTPHYLQRACTETRHGVTVVIPHVRDILLAKLHRSRVDRQEGLVPKDRRAFQRVRELSGGRPNEADVIEDLRLCEPSLRVPGDGSVNSFRLNVLDLFSTIFGRPVDLELEILRPAREAEVVRHGGQGPEIDDLISGLEPTRD